MKTKSILIAAALLASFSSAFAGTPLGYFTDVQPVPGIDQGSYRDYLGSVTPDGLEIYFDSDIDAPTRPPFGSAGPYRDLYVARRASRDEPFGPRELLDFSIEDIADQRPTISFDGLTLTFDSTRAPDGGSLNTSPSWAVTRETLDGEWSEPAPTVDIFPIEEVDALDLHNPVVSADGLRIVFGSNAVTDFDLYSATRNNLNEPFGNVTRLEVNRSGLQEDKGVLSFDERTLFFARFMRDWTVPQMYIAHRESTDVPFDNEMVIDRFSLGRSNRDRHEDAETINFAAATWAPAVSPDWPADGSKFYFSTTCCGDNFDIYEATWRQATPIAGDITSDGVLDAADIAIVSKAARFSINAPGFDLNSDGTVNSIDRDYWITILANTWYGDANLDGEFNSEDFVVVFQAGEYEDGIAMNSTWATGDWNGDGDFDTSDFVKAFEDGGYEKGPKMATQAVPEPSGVWPLVLLGSLWLRRARPGHFVGRQNRKSSITTKHLVKIYPLAKQRNMSSTKC